jgi:hypothetical protein
VPSGGCYSQSLSWSTGLGLQPTPHLASNTTVTNKDTNSHSEPHCPASPAALDTVSSRVPLQAHPPSACWPALWRAAVSLSTSGQTPSGLGPLPITGIWGGGYGRYFGPLLRPVCNQRALRAPPSSCQWGEVVLGLVELLPPDKPFPEVVSSTTSWGWCFPAPHFTVCFCSTFVGSSLKPTT